MIVRYVPRKRVGLLTPCANPAFEPEMRALLPDDVAVHATRLPVMAGTTLVERNDRYIPSYEDALGSFGDLPLDATAVGITGPSYALTIAEDEALQTRLSEVAERPVVLASRAIARVLARAGMARIVVFSPYPGWLTERAEAYWRRAGCEIVDVFKVSETFRAYELTPPEVI
ncbi:MAG: hypothetical protein JOY70_00545, partial [Acidisphaera sp.]|nr:hypothetical protein [Acidisphaera sp.]